MSKESFFAHRYTTQSMIVLFAILLFVVVYWVCGTIAVNAGTGWDGSIYLNYIERLARGGHSWRSVSFNADARLWSFDWRCRTRVVANVLLDLSNVGEWARCFHGAGVVLFSLDEYRVRTKVGVNVDSFADVDLARIGHAGVLPNSQ